MIRRPPRSTLFPTRRSSDLTRLDRLIGHHRERSLERGVFGYHQAKLPRRSLLGGVRAFPGAHERLFGRRGGNGLGGRGLGGHRSREKDEKSQGAHWGSLVDAGFLMLDGAEWLPVSRTVDEPALSAAKGDR